LTGPVNSRLVAFFVFSYEGFQVVDHDGGNWEHIPEEVHDEVDCKWVLDYIELSQEINGGSRDVGEREEDKDVSDSFSLFLQLFREVLLNVNGEVDVGGGEQNRYQNQLTGEECLVDNDVPLFWLWNDCCVGM